MTRITYRTALAALAVTAVVLGGCSEETPAEPSPVPAEPAVEAPPPDPYPNEACIEGPVVSYAGAQGAPEGVTRSKEEARQKAEALRARVVAGEDLAAVARAEGDGSRAERGGQLGTFARDEWPSLHAPLKDPVFALQVGELSEIVEAPYGFVFVRRCPVEKVRTRHILIRYRGALNARPDVRRTREQALDLARRVREEVTAEGADFATVARHRSEDGSAASGGDLGLLGRGLLYEPYEDAAFALQVGEISQPVETPFGFHIIQRTE